MGDDPFFSGKKGSPYRKKKFLDLETLSSRGVLDMKRVFILERRCVLLIVFWLIFSVPSFGEEGLERVILQGEISKAYRFISGIKNKDKQAAYRSVVQYRDPTWYIEDVSLLKKYSKYTVPLMGRIILLPIPKGVDDASMVRTKVRFIQALSYMGQGVEYLIKALRDKNVFVRKASIVALGKIGDKRASLPLYKYLKTEHIPDFNAKNFADLVKEETVTRVIAIGVLASLQDKSLIPSLIKEYKGGTLADRKTAAAILTGYKEESLKNLYVDMLQDRDMYIKVYAASALRDMGDERGFDILKDLFYKTEGDKRLWIFNILTQWKSKKTVSFFLDYLKKVSEQGSFRFFPLSVIGKDFPRNNFPSIESNIAYNMERCIIQWRDISIPLVERFYKESSGNACLVAMEILAEAKDKKALPLLKKSIKSENPLHRYYALWAIGRIGGDVDVSKFAKEKNKYLQAVYWWYKVKKGTNEGVLKKALDLLDEEDPYLKADGMYILYLLRDKEEGSYIYYALPSIKDPLTRILGIISLGVLGYGGNLDPFATSSPVESFYRAEALCKITGTPKRYRYKEGTFQKIYGNGIYNAFDYARVLLLYISKKPLVYGKIRDIPIAFVSSKSDALLMENPNSKSGVEIPYGTRVFVLENKRTLSKVSMVDGKVGWVERKNLHFVGRCIENTSRRFKMDFGYRWDDDLISIIERDYIGKGNFKVHYTNPANYFSTKAMVNVANWFVYLNTGVKDEVSVEGVSTGDRVISGSISPSCRFEFVFDLNGNLKRVEVK